MGYSALLKSVDLTKNVFIMAHSQSAEGAKLL